MAAVVNPATPNGEASLHRLRPLRAWVCHVLYGGMPRWHPGGSLFHYYHEDLLREAASVMASHGGMLPRGRHDEGRGN
jgi:hypothetical protein